jgi:hypothetical protein
MDAASLTRSIQTNKNARRAAWVFIGLLWFANVHYSMAQLRSLNPNPTLMDEVIYFVIAASGSAFCFLGMGIITNGYAVRWLASYIGQQVKSAKSFLEVGAICLAATLVIGVVLLGLLKLYQWDLFTTRVGTNLVGYPLLSTASVPAWLLVLGPDLGCTAINISGQIDGLLRGAKAGSNPRQSQGGPNTMGGNPLSDLL